MLDICHFAKKGLTEPTIDRCWICAGADALAAGLRQAELMLEIG